MSKFHSRRRKAKLTDKQVAEIRKRWDPYVVTQRDLADEYGLSQGQISQIVRNQIYYDPNYDPDSKWHRKTRKEFHT